MIWKVKKPPFDWFLHPYNFLTEHPKTAHSARLSFNLIYNLEAVAACPKIFMGLALVHFKKYWLLRHSKVFIFFRKLKRFLEKTLPEIIKKKITWNIKCLVDKSFVPATQRSTVSYWRLSYFYIFLFTYETRQLKNRRFFYIQ